MKDPCDKKSVTDSRYSVFFGANDILRYVWSNCSAKSSKSNFWIWKHGDSNKTPFPKQMFSCKGYSKLQAAANSLFLLLYTKSTKYGFSLSSS